MKNIKKHGFLFDLILILITGGLWNIWMQYRQIRDFNNLSKYKKYSFLNWFLLTLITIGVYHIIHEYRLTKDICELNQIGEKESIAIFAAIISMTGLWIFVDLYQQEVINNIIEKEHVRNI